MIQCLMGVYLHIKIDHPVDNVEDYECDWEEETANEIDHLCVIPIKFENEISY